jgi:hypothetical protein
MEQLIELIVRALIALFSGSSEKTPAPPPRQAPKIPPIRTNPPAMQPRQMQQRRPQTMTVRPMTRAEAMRQIAMRQAATRRGAGAPPPMPPKLVAAHPPLPRPAPPKAVETASAAPATKSKTTLSAAAIRQLMLSRKSAMRTIYVLSEVVGPPVALR